MFFVQTSVQEEVCPEITVEKLGLLSVIFYAISTEYRFLERKDLYMKSLEGSSIGQLQQTLLQTNSKIPKSELYLGRALEISFTF